MSEMTDEDLESYHQTAVLRALNEWRDAGGHSIDVLDAIEGLIDYKVDRAARDAFASPGEKP